MPPGDAGLQSGVVIAVTDQPAMVAEMEGQSLVLRSGDACRWGAADTPGLRDRPAARHIVR